MTDQTINGIRIPVVAQLVAGQAVRCSDDEHRIARKVQRIGEKLERQGWLPDLRRRRMLAVIVSEARLVRTIAVTRQDGLSGVLAAGIAKDQGEEQNATELGTTGL